MYLYFYLGVCICFCTCSCPHIGNLEQHPYANLYLYLGAYLYLFLYLCICICTCCRPHVSNLEQHPHANVRHSQGGRAPIASSPICSPSPPLAYSGSNCAQTTLTFSQMIYVQKCWLLNIAKVHTRALIATSDLIDCSAHRVK